MHSELDRYLITKLSPYLLQISKKYREFTESLHSCAREWLRESISRGNCPIDQSIVWNPYAYACEANAFTWPPSHASPNYNPYMSCLRWSTRFPISGVCWRFLTGFKSTHWPLRTVILDIEPSAASAKAVRNISSDMLVSKVTIHRLHFDISGFWIALKWTVEM